MTRTVARNTRGEGRGRGTFEVLRETIADYETYQAAANDDIVVAFGEVGGGADMDVVRCGRGE